jgi:hypothetical protein
MAIDRISELSEDIEDLFLFLLKEEENFKRAIKPTVDDLVKFRDDFLSALKEKIDSYILRYADSLEEIDLKLEDISKTIPIVFQQKENLLKMMSYSPQEETFNEVTKFLTSLKGKQKGEHVFSNYLSLTGDLQKNLKSEFVQLSNDAKSVLNQTWWPRCSFTTSIIKIFQDYSESKAKEL